MRDFRELLDQELTFIAKNLRKEDEAKGAELEVSDFQEPSEHREMVAIDGSYSFLLNISNIWLGVVRVGAMHYRYEEDAGFRLLGAEVIERPELVTLSRETAELMGERHVRLYDRAVGTSSEPHREMLNQLRKMAEEEMALDCVNRHRGAIVAMDGTLTPFKGTKTLESVLAKAGDRDNMVVGVSKDSYTRALGFARTDEEHLSRTMPEPGFVGVPGLYQELEGSKVYGGVLGDVYFAKMHPDSPKWFRVDVGTHKDVPGEVFGQLSTYASSAMCPGYIYPLLEAHRYVVTVRHFHDLYENMVLDKAQGAGLGLQDVMDGLTHMEGRRRSAFHEYLDKFARDI